MPGWVLLVDDERFSRTVYSDYLRAAGYSVEEADSAESALESLRRRRFDLLVTDLIMPGANGIELLGEAKRLDPTIETLVVSAVDRVDSAVLAMKSGASDYLVKPVTPEALHVAAESCLSARALLAQNKILRSHLQLFDTCQRITAALDHGRAVSLALEAVVNQLGAAAAIFLERAEAGELVPAGSIGIDADRAGLVSDALLKLATGRPGELPLRVAFTVDGAPMRAMVLPVVQQGGSSGGVLCALLAADPDPQRVGSAEFVCSHLALALRTLGHLERVEHLAYLDDLTNLYNTRFLDLVFDREVEAGRPFTVLFLDLDRFKGINDQYGHLVGSKLLVEVGRVLKGCVRDEDVVARYGGDEYAAVLLGIDSGGALKVAERIRRSIEDHVFLSREGSRVRVTTSIGLAGYPEHATTKAEVLDLADRAMYRGKRTTRNVVYIASRDLPPAPTR